MASSNDTSNFLIAEAQLALDQARKEKSERTKTLGDPIQLPGKPLDIRVRGNEAWIAESTAIVRRLNLESGKTICTFKGHTGPVTTIAFCDKTIGSGDNKILISGSWDQTIKLWDLETKEMISSSEAHSDFVKTLFVFSSLRLLVSSGSDKIVRFWNISAPTQLRSLSSMGSISSHTRPVECIEGRVISETSAILYTADTMGIIKVWSLTKETGTSPRWRSTLKEELNYHRTRINEIVYGNGHLWTASTDENVCVLPDTSADDSTPKKLLNPISHKVAVRSILPLSVTDLDEPVLLTGSGDIIRVYDMTSLEEPELIQEIDAHWHDVTAIRLWMRESVGDDNKRRIEPWIISASLDGTIRRWRLSELLNPPPPSQAELHNPPIVQTINKPEERFAMTEEEEKELAELLDE